MNVVANSAGTVLVADDDEFMLTLVSSVISDAGYTVLVARDGAEALEVCASQSLDCIVTDVNMPRMNGFELCAAARLMPHGERMQILILTGSDDRDSVKRAFEVGANDFAIKGVAPELLVERIHFLLKAQCMQDALRHSEERLSHAQRLARLGHWERTPDGHTLAVSPVVTQLLELTGASQLDWRSFCALVHPDDRETLETSVAHAVETMSIYRVEHRVICKSNRIRVLQHQGEMVQGNRDDEWLIRATLQDITERRAQEDRISFLVHHDPLTALPNRESVTRSLAGILQEHDHTPNHIAVFALGVDDFSRINGSLGHNVGDMVLKTLGDRLRSSIRDHDRILLESAASDDDTCLVARGEGDRFFCVFPKLAVSESAFNIARRLQGILAAPLQMGDTELTLSASVGVSLFPDDGKSASQLLDNALTALNHARGEKGAVEFFTQEISARARQRLQLETELRQAIDHGQFELHYQPRLNLLSNQIEGAEALIRWHHPQRGMVPPGEFIPLVEEQGLIAPLGNLVIDMAVRQVSQWQDRWGTAFRLSFNISPLQFTASDLMAEIDQAVQRHHACYSHLEAEITESALMARPELVINILQALRERNIKLALDDFGTGYSSLSYLQKLPLDVLKIDRSFISQIGISRNGTSLVNAMLLMARALDLSCVSEGVETEVQLEFLRQAGCEEMQGFLISKALPADQFEQFIINWQATHALSLRA